MPLNEKLFYVFDCDDHKCTSRIIADNKSDLAEKLKDRGWSKHPTRDIAYCKKHKIEEWCTL